MTPIADRLRSALADRYAVDREVGRGGMATVYLAHDVKHDRQVALKVLHPELAASLGPERFLREIKVAARLNHPHIVPLHDSGQAGDLLYYVMPYVDGESLRQRLIREKRLTLDEALEIARDVAAALDYAHRQGVVHRDIKPENVMMHEGEALVTDFGIAKAVTAAANDNLTQTGSAVGTPAYMSPEQAAGEAELDGRSDVYSLGCMVYEMLSGSAPFTGSTAQAVITKRFTETPPSIRAARSTVPEAVDTAVSRSLARVPAERYATAAQFGQALAIHGSTPPVTSRQPWFHKPRCRQVDRRAPLRRHELGTGPGILLRRHGGRNHQCPLARSRRSRSPRAPRPLPSRARTRTSGRSAGSSKSRRCWKAA